MTTGSPGDAVRLKGNPNWESLASGMGNRRCGGQFHPPSADQAALRLLPEAAAVSSPYRGRCVFFARTPGALATSSTDAAGLKSYV